MGSAIVRTAYRYQPPPPRKRAKAATIEVPEIVIIRRKPERVLPPGLLSATGEEHLPHVRLLPLRLRHTQQLHYHTVQP
jgi:hypothetical protein